GNFAVVEMVFVFLRERRRWLVGIVRIVQVYPHKVRSGAMFLEPTLSVTNDLHAAALDAAPAFFTLGRGGKVIVEIETAIEAGTECVAVENHGSDECRGLVAALFQQFRRSGVLRREWDSEVGDAVYAGQEAGKNRNVRSVRDRAMREGLSEADTIGGERIERRRFDLLVSVAPDMVGAQGIDGDKKHVGRGCPWGGSVAPGGNSQHNGERKHCKSL